MKNYTLVGSFEVNDNILIDDGNNGYYYLDNPIKGTWNMWIEKPGQIVNSVFASVVSRFDRKPLSNTMKNVTFHDENQFREVVGLPTGVLFFTGVSEKVKTMSMRDTIEDSNHVFIKDNVCYAAFSASADKCHIEANMNESKKIYSFTISPQIGMGDTSGGFGDDF